MKKTFLLLPFLMSVLLVVTPFKVFSVPMEISAAMIDCTPENTVMNIVAHEDDSLLFQNPDLLHNINNGLCVQTVFLTAGDAGMAPVYWHSRENGVRAAYAEIAGVQNSWNETDINVFGHMLTVYKLEDNTNVSLVFLRLPDGGIDGNGINGNGSLKNLWDNSISLLTAIDNSSSYTRQNLINTLSALMTNLQPSQINTQNYMGTFGDGDHSDHHASAFFARSAHESYISLHTINAYLGYVSEQNPINVSEDDLVLKNNVFFTYTPFDPGLCQSYEECTGVYADWLNRQYIVASEVGGTPDACSNMEGVQTVIPNGYQVTNGECVADPLVCNSYVSDTTDITDAGQNAVATFVPSTWTAGANIPGATWIWNSFYVSDPASGGMVTFTKQIEISGNITSASIVIASDDNYEASFNGSQFGNEAKVNNFTAGNEDIYDITSLIQNGQNILAITVHNIATGDSDPELNPAGLRYKLDISKDDCNPIIAPVNNMPEITLNGVNPVNLNVNDEYIDAGATAIDFEDGTISSILILGTVDSATVGTYTLIYGATDSGGLSATTTRTINVVAKDTNGNETGGNENKVDGGGVGMIYSKPILPLAVVINDNDEITNNINVTLDFTAGLDIKKIAISNNSGFDGVSQEDYSAEKAWVLPQGQGVKTVYVKFFNQYGIASEIFTDTIRLEDVEVLGAQYYPSGTLIRGNNHKIYEVKNDNGRKHIRTFGELALRFFGQEILNVLQDVVDQYQDVR